MKYVVYSFVNEIIDTNCMLEIALKWMRRLEKLETFDSFGNKL